MPLVWDSQLQAFVETAPPLVYDPVLEAYRETEGLVYNPALEAWQKVWPERPEKLYLYRDGDECTDVTGGWYPWAESDVTINMESDHIQIVKVGTKWQLAQLCCRNPADLAKYHTMHIVLSGSAKNGNYTGTSHNAAYCNFCFYTKFCTTWDDSSYVMGAEAGYESRQDFTLSETEFTGDTVSATCYPAIRFSSGNTGAQAEFCIKRIWLEK